MSDLIDRQAAINAISCDITITGRQNAELVAATIGAFADRIKALPSAQPERKTGKWIDEGFYADGHGAHAFRCSECGGHIIEYDADPFCKWCGADMRGTWNETN